MTYLFFYHQPVRSALRQSLLWLSLLGLILGPLLAMPVSAKEARGAIQWLEPVSDIEELTQKALQQSNIVTDFAELVAREFDIGSGLSIIVGGQGTPRYDETNNSLRLPYSYLVAAVQAQSELLESREQALASGMDMVEYTLYHELGHILAGDMSVDADASAEDIATWVMLTHWPNGGEQWFVAVDAFARASQLLDGPLSDYWHSHSLYKSRQREINCLILGLDPERYERLLPAVLEPQTRREQCVGAWQELDIRVKAQISSSISGH